MVDEETPAPKPKADSTKGLTLGLILSTGLYALIRFVLLADDPLTPQSHWFGLKVTGWPEDLQGYMLPFDVGLTSIGLMLTFRATFSWRKRIKAAKVKKLVRIVLYIGLTFVYGFSISCLLLPGIFGWLTTLELALYAGLLVWGVLIGLLAMVVGLYCLGRLVILMSEIAKWAFRRRRAKAAAKTNAATLDALRAKRSPAKTTSNPK
jgi:hypothetical protein